MHNATITFNWTGDVIRWPGKWWLKEKVLLALTNSVGDKFGEFSGRCIVFFYATTWIIIDIIKKLQFWCKNSINTVLQGCWYFLFLLISQQLYKIYHITDINQFLLPHKGHKGNAKFLKFFLTTTKALKNPITNGDGTVYTGWVMLWFRPKIMAWLCNFKTVNTGAKYKFLFFFF